MTRVYTKINKGGSYPLYLWIGVVNLQQKTVFYKNIIIYIMFAMNRKNHAVLVEDNGSINLYQATWSAVFDIFKHVSQQRLHPSLQRMLRTMETHATQRWITPVQMAWIVHEVLNTAPGQEMPKAEELAHHLWGQVKVTIDDRQQAFRTTLWTRSIAMQDDLLEISQGHGIPLDDLESMVGNASPESLGQELLVWYAKHFPAVAPLRIGWTNSTNALHILHRMHKLLHQEFHPYTSEWSKINTAIEFSNQYCQYPNPWSIKMVPIEKRVALNVAT
jgi:hypothetical protein